MEDKDLYKSIGRIEAGIEAVNKRFDNVDALLKEHTKNINTLQSYQDTQKGEVKMIAMIWSIIVGGIVSIISAFFKNN